MKLLILTLVAACSLTALTGCADDRQNTSTSTYQQSAYVDSKDMHHRQGQ